MMRHEPHSFWQFSLGLYRIKDVADACLLLQDRCGADVNLLLYCCWLGEAGRTLDKRALRAAMAAVCRWQSEVIKPLRLVRRTLKSLPDNLTGCPTGALRKRIGALEIDMEYVEQKLLAEASLRLPVAKRRSPPRLATAASIARYLALLEVTAGRAEAQVATILDACCPIDSKASARKPKGKSKTALTR